MWRRVLHAVRQDCLPASCNFLRQLPLKYDLCGTSSIHDNTFNPRSWGRPHALIEFDRFAFNTEAWMQYRCQQIDAITTAEGTDPGRLSCSRADGCCCVNVLVPCAANAKQVLPLIADDGCASQPDICGQGRERAKVVGDGRTSSLASGEDIAAYD